MADHTSNRGLHPWMKISSGEIASKGGQASGGNFKNDPERAAEAGHKGGQASGGNFKTILNAPLKRGVRAGNTDGALL
jgi:hypothetical protein